MENPTITRLEKSMDKSKIFQIKPEKTELDRVLSIQSSDLVNMTDQEISRSIYTLCQHQVWLQAYCNIKHIKYLDAKRVYDLHLAKATLGMQGKTLKEKNLKVYLESKELQDLEKDLKIKEEDYLLFDKIPEAIGELVNALKKELSIRIPKQPTRYG